MNSKSFSSQIGTTSISSSAVSIPKEILLNHLQCLANPADFIEIKFEVGSQDLVLGLNAYMNTLLNTNENTLRF
jgi:hypothetical protein